MRSWCYLRGQGVSIKLIKCGAPIFSATVVTWWPSILRLQAPTKNQRVMSLLHFPGPFLFVFLGPLGAFTPHPTRAAVNPNAGPCGPMRRARISDPDFTSCTGHQMTSKLAVSDFKHVHNHIMSESVSSEIGNTSAWECTFLCVRFVANLGGCRQLLN